MSVASIRSRGLLGMIVVGGGDALRGEPVVVRAGGAGTTRPAGTTGAARPHPRAESRPERPAARPGAVPSAVPGPHARGHRRDAGRMDAAPTEDREGPAAPAGRVHRPRRHGTAVPQQQHQLHRPQRQPPAGGVAAATAARAATAPTGNDPPSPVATKAQELQTTLQNKDTPPDELKQKLSGSPPGPHQGQGRRRQGPGRPPRNRHRPAGVGAGDDGDPGVDDRPMGTPGVPAVRHDHQPPLRADSFSMQGPARGPTGVGPRGADPSCVAEARHLRPFPSPEYPSWRSSVRVIWRSRAPAPRALVADSPEHRRGGNPVIILPKQVPFLAPVLVRLDADGRSPHSTVSRPFIWSLLRLPSALAAARRRIPSPADRRPPADAGLISATTSSRSSPSTATTATPTAPTRAMSPSTS